MRQCKYSGNTVRDVIGTGLIIVFFPKLKKNIEIYGWANNKRTVWKPAKKELSPPRSLSPPVKHIEGIFS